MIKKCVYTIKCHFCQFLLHFVISIKASFYSAQIWIVAVFFERILKYCFYLTKTIFVIKYYFFHYWCIMLSPWKNAEIKYFFRKLKKNWSEEMFVKPCQALPQSENFYPISILNFSNIYEKICNLASKAFGGYGSSKLFIWRVKPRGRKNNLKQQYSTRQF